MVLVVFSRSRLRSEEFWQASEEGIDAALHVETDTGMQAPMMLRAEPADIERPVIVEVVTLNALGFAASGLTFFRPQDAALLHGGVQGLLGIDRVRVARLPIRDSLAVDTPVLWLFAPFTIAGRLRCRQLQCALASTICDAILAIVPVAVSGAVVLREGGARLALSAGPAFLAGRSESGGRLITYKWTTLEGPVPD